MDAAFLRNFAIIAHIDHGKSTLADRLLELTGSLTAREMQAQVLDSMDLERERGITIKAHAVRMMYTAQDGQTYQLNLIDTPGHVDFSYEVSRSLASCEGALLVVDASQGVEAQTLANSYLAINHGLEIIPVINKIDLPSADIARTKEMIEGAVGLDASDAMLISAKTGQGVPDVLEAIVKRVPPPKGNPDNQLQALIFDSWFDPYRGVIVLTRVFQGTLRKGQKIRLDVEWTSVGSGNSRRADAQAGGDRRTARRRSRLPDRQHQERGRHQNRRHDHRRRPIPRLSRCPALKKSSPWFLPASTRWTPTSTRMLREALEKLRLNDSSFFFEPESSVALGFRLPLRLSRPAAHGDHSGAAGARIQPGPDHHRAQRALQDHQDRRRIDRSGQSFALAGPSEIAKIEEPVILATILTNEEYVGGILKLVEEKRGKQKTFEYVSSSRVMLHYELPLNEIVLDFYDRLKSVSRGYASLDYHLVGLLGIAHGETRHPGGGRAGGCAFHHRAPRFRLRARARRWFPKCGELIPRQMFEVAIQASIGAKIICPRNRAGHSQERDRQVLRRRHHPQTQAAGKTKRRQEAHEAHRPRGYSAGSVPGGAEGGRRGMTVSCRSDRPLESSSWSICATDTVFRPKNTDVTTRGNRALHSAALACRGHQTSELSSRGSL